MHRHCFYLAVSVLLCSQAPARAQSSPSLAERALAFDIGCCTPPSGWQRIGATRLDQQRGGFDLPSGLTMSLGIDRMVTINGQLVAQSSMRIASLSSISADEARQARNALGGSTLVQNGAGNVASLPAGPGIYVQNTLNDQLIGTRTVINASVNSAGLIKDLNFNAGLRDALVRVIPIH